MGRLANATNTWISGPDPEKCLQTKVPNYALIFFDHLYSEYLALKVNIHNPELIQLLDSIHAKRVKKELTWSDVYAFDLALIDVRPLENLVRKAYDARAKYRSIAGQKEYDEYVASKPPDLTAILIKPGALRPEPGTPEEFITSPPIIQSPPLEQPEPGLPEAEIVQRVLRADIRYLLNKFYLYYAMLPLRECLRDQLTSQALRVTCLSLLTFLIFLVLSFAIGGPLLKSFWHGELITAAFGLTVGAVLFFGIVGGCVSMLQRIQSAPTEGDALFNLAAISNGWSGLSLSPLYGGIFATLLFIMFAAGILQGSIFPKIETAAGSQILVDVKEAAAMSAAATPTPSPGASPAASPEASPAASPAASPTATANPTATPTPTPTDTQKTGVLQLKDFLTRTGPKDGASFALLLLWSFIAGFAERFVPDTLNRFVAKSQAVQGTTP